MQSTRVGGDGLTAHLRHAHHLQVRVLIHPAHLSGRPGQVLDSVEETIVRAAKQDEDICCRAGDD